MLKTISYSIQLVSSIIEGKEQGKQYEVKIEDDIFNSLKSSIAIRKILVDVFNDDNITIKTLDVFPKDKFVSSNGFVFSFKFPAALSVEYTYKDNEKNNKEVQEQKQKDIQKIINAIIEEIKKIDENNKVICEIGIKYLYEIDCENPDEKINSLFKETYEDEERSIVAKTFKKDDKTKLNLSIRDGINNEKKIILNCNFEIKVKSDNEIKSILEDKKLEEYLINKIKRMGFID